MKNITLSALAAFALMGSAASAADGISLEHQGQNATYVRVTPEGKKFLLIPVQESSPLSEIWVLKDGKYDRKLNIALANSKIDYFVPFELTPYEGHKLLLDVRSNFDRSNLREASDAIWGAEMVLSDEFDTTNREKYRPAYHHTPLYGWMNDPNGMFYKDGIWHFYYQHNPYGSKWQNLSWGHSSSKDLVHWDHHGDVLEPEGTGMIFSGSSVVDKNNTAGFGEDAVVALYTSADAMQTQSLAYSTDDGATFTPYAGNPILVYPRESRDPNMFWDEANGRWVLLIASALDHEMLVFHSNDLKEWKLASKFGHGYGSQEGVWECPDLMEFTLPDGSHKWALLCNINPGHPFGGSGTQYFVGDFDGTTFVCDDAPEVQKWMDYGKDHYATVSFSNAPDGRHTVVGWMSNWQYANEVPTQQYRSANTLPRDLSLFKGPDGSYYIASTPADEVNTLRNAEKKFGSATISSKEKTYTLPQEPDGLYEIIFSADLRQGQTLDFSLRNAEGEYVAMSIDPKADTFSMDRRQSGLTDFSEHFPAVTVSPALNGTGKYDVRIFVDRSSVEAFSADGHFAMTNLVFPASPYKTLTFSSKGGNAKISDLKVYTLK